MNMINIANILYHNISLVTYSGTDETPDDRRQTMSG